MVLWGTWRVRSLSSPSKCLFFLFLTFLLASRCNLPWCAIHPQMCIYNDALKRSNFHAEINYEPSANTNSINKRRTRQRNTIWYNPPLSKNVTTNIARNFLLLLDKHFPPHHRLHSIFNRHTVRVSYSCSDNMKSFLSTTNTC